MVNPRPLNYTVVCHEQDLPKSAPAGDIYYCARTNEVYAGKGMYKSLELIKPKKNIFRKSMDWIKAKFRKWGAE